MTKFLIPALAVIFMASTAVIFANFHKIEPYLTLFEPTFEDKVAEAARLVEIEKCLKDQFGVRSDVDPTDLRQRVLKVIVQDFVSAYKNGRLKDHVEFRVLSEIESGDITLNQADERLANLAARAKKAFYLQCFEIEETNQ